MPFRIQQVYAPPNSTKDRFFRLISKAQISSQPTLNQERQDFGHKIRNVVRIVFNRNFPTLPVPKKLRRIQHQQP